MKNFSKTIASVGLSLLAIGAMAQNLTGIKIIPKTLHRANNVPLNFNMHKVSSTNTYAFLDYVYSDSVAANSFSEGYSASPSIGAGYFIQEINRLYTPADTGTVFPDFNNLLLTNCSVAFTQLLDANNSTLYTVNSGLTVDSVYIPIGSQNVSGKNDTLTVAIYGIGANGIPDNTTSLWDTVIVQDTGLSGAGKNWFAPYTLKLTPKKFIPGNGEFAVTMTYSTPNKRDSMGFLYAFPTYTCASPSEAQPDTTFIGTAIPVTNGPSYGLMANSFSTGYEYFMTNHMGTPVTLPDVNNGDFIGYNCTSPSEFSAGPFQEIVMFAWVNMVNAGVSNITSAGLSVSQNHPNPFNKQTQINYTLTKSSNVTFSVHDMTGRVLVNNVYTNSSAGEHIINLDANSFTPGVYFYTFNVNGSTVTKKMVITE